MKFFFNIYFTFVLDCKNHIASFFFYCKDRFIDTKNPLILIRFLIHNNNKTSECKINELQQKINKNFALGFTWKNIIQYKLDLINEFVFLKIFRKWIFIYICC